MTNGGKWCWHVLTCAGTLLVLQMARREQTALFFEARRVLCKIKYTKGLSSTDLIATITPYKWWWCSIHSINCNTIFRQQTVTQKAPASKTAPKSSCSAANKCPLTTEDFVADNNNLQTSDSAGTRKVGHLIPKKPWTTVEDFGPKQRIPEALARLLNGTKNVTFRG